MFRIPRALLPYLLLAALLAGALLWRESENLPGLGKVVSTGTADVGGPFTLTDQNGRKISDGDFRGRYMLVYFGYSMCPDVCPTTLAVISDALDKMGANAQRIVPVFITIDPERDTPQVLRPYMKSFGPRFVGLTGTDAQIAAVEKAYHVYAKKTPLDPAKGIAGGYGMDHSSVIYLMGPDGRMVAYYEDLTSPDDLAKELASKVAG